MESGSLVYIRWSLELIFITDEVKNHKTLSFSKKLFGPFIENVVVKNWFLSIAFGHDNDNLRLKRKPLLCNLVCSPCLPRSPSYFRAVLSTISMIWESIKSVHKKWMLSRIINQCFVEVPLNQIIACLLFQVLFIRHRVFVSSKFRFFFVDLTSIQKFS